MMKTLATVIPLALTALSGLIIWHFLALAAGPDISQRLPGEAGTFAPEDRQSTSATAGIAGRLIPGTGRPTSMPGEWPEFRGPTRDGVSREATALSYTWPVEGPEAIWSCDLGEGYAGAAVKDGRVFVLDYDAQAEGDALRCLALADGKEIWRYVYPVKIKRNHGMSRTVPAVGNGHVVTLGPKCHVLCLEADNGKLKWSLDLQHKFGTKEPLWYAGQCPLIDGSRAIIAPAGTETMVIAVDIQTGEQIWAAPNTPKWKMTHSSIAVMELDGRKMYIYCGSGGIAGIDAADGEILWQSDAWKINTATVPTPVVLPGGRIFCSGGYNSGSMMLQISKDPAGYGVGVLFKLKPQVFGATQHTPIYYDGCIYGVRPNGDLTCLDESGKVLWASQQENFGLGPFLISGDLIYLLDDGGTLSLARISRDGYKILARAKVLPGPEAWGPMALAGGRLIVRDLRKMVCLDVGAK